MDCFEQAEVLQTGHDRNASRLIEYQIELVPDTFPANAIHERQGLMHEFQCAIFNSEPESLFQADGTQHPGRIIDKAERVKHADPAFLQVAPTAPMVDQLAIVRSVEPQSQRVDREISSMQIELDAPRLDGGQGGRMRIELRPGRNEVQRGRKVRRDRSVHLERLNQARIIRVQPPLGRPEAAMAAYAAPVALNQKAG